MTQIWSEIWKEVIRWWKKVWFEAKLTARLKMIELENRWESEQERKERFEPIYQEKEVDNELQTGESRLLGGECDSLPNGLQRLRQKWKNLTEEEKQMKIQLAVESSSRIESNKTC